MLNQPCIPGINPIRSWCIILFICCWIPFARILLRIFASIFITVKIFSQTFQQICPPPVRHIVCILIRLKEITQRRQVPFPFLEDSTPCLLIFSILDWPPLGPCSDVTLRPSSPRFCRSAAPWAVWGRGLGIVEADLGPTVVKRPSPVFLCTCTHTLSHLHTHAHTDMHMHIYTPTHTHRHAHAYLHTHAHTHSAYYPPMQRDLGLPQA